MLPNLSLLLLLPAASALNNIFNPTPYQECNACVDAAANSCPGDYETKAYATCLCAGAGSAGIAGCLSTCDAVDTQPMGAADKVAGNFFSYCIMFFPDLCAEAEYYVRKDWWAEKCGPGAVKGAGFGRESTSGDPSGNSGSGGESGGGSGGGGSGGASGSGASATGGTGFSGPGTGSGSQTAGSSPSQATSAAGSNIHPVGWGVVVGFGILGLNM